MLLIQLTILFTLGLSQLIDQPVLGIGSLGRIGFTGKFDGIEVQQYPGQNVVVNASSVFKQLPDGQFKIIVSANGALQALTSFILSDGTLAGLILAGNFTRIGGIDAVSIAFFNPGTYEITPLSGVNGTIQALLCIPATNAIYIGGNFEGANSTSALAWIGTTGWANLPFAGFNGAVNAIALSPSGNILFGGAFTHLGQTGTPNCTTPQQKNSSNCSIEFSDGNIYTFPPPPNCNGLFEYNPNMATVSSDFTHSAFTEAGIALDADAQVNCLMVSGHSIYVAGNFTSNAYNNIFELSNIDSDSNQTSDLGGGGLDNQIRALLLEGNTIYVGGDFKATRDTGAQSVVGLNHVAAWDVVKRAWMPLGGGVNGPVQRLNVLQLNITDKPEAVIIVNGNFDTLLALEGFGALAAKGIGIWVPSRNQWLPNLDVQQPSLTGTLVQTLQIPKGYLAGIGEFSLRAYEQEAQL
jgi:hypothetical protein